MNNFIIVNTREHSIAAATKPPVHLNEEWRLISDSTFLSFSNSKKNIIVIGDYIGTEEDTGLGHHGVHTAQRRPKRLLGQLAKKHRL